MSDIRLDGVTKRYGTVAAADNVDLAVAQGEFVTILGPSGSGKTTLLSLIAASTGRPRAAGKHDTVPKKMFNELVLEVNPTITAVATLLIGLTVLALAAVTLILARAGKLKQTIV